MFAKNYCKSVRKASFAAAVVISIGLLLAFGSGAWSQSPSDPGGKTRPAQTNSGSKGTVLEMDSSDLLFFDDPAVDLENCDKAASSPSDPKRPPEVAGVPFNKIDAKSAIEACSVAVQTNPKSARAEFEFGRALEAGAQYNKAWIHLHKSAGAAYAAAMSSIGHWYEHGTGGLKDLVAAEAWYKRAVDAGDSAINVDLKRLEQSLSSTKGSGNSASMAPHAPSRTAEAKQKRLYTWDPKYESIDPGDWIQIVRFEQNLGVYQIVTFEDPTVLAIYATPKSLAASIPSLDENALKAHPQAIVGEKYELRTRLAIESEDK